MSISRARKAVANSWCAYPDSKKTKFPCESEWRELVGKLQVRLIDDDEGPANALPAVSKLRLVIQRFRSSSIRHRDRYRSKLIVRCRQGYVSRVPVTKRLRTRGYRPGPVAERGFHITFEHTLRAFPHWMSRRVCHKLRAVAFEEFPVLLVNDIELTVTVGSWTQWQEAVIELLRTDFNEVLQHIGLDEVDWPAWRTFYNEGRTPRAAIDRALERDF